jgi:hypothetical protein
MAIISLTLVASPIDAHNFLKILAFRELGTAVWISKIFQQTPAALNIERRQVLYLPYTLTANSVSAFTCI